MIGGVVIYHQVCKYFVDKITFIRVCVPIVRPRHPGEARILGTFLFKHSFYSNGGTLVHIETNDCHACHEQAREQELKDRADRGSLPVDEVLPDEGSKVTEATLSHLKY